MGKEPPHLASSISQCRHQTFQPGSATLLTGPPPSLMGLHKVGNIKQAPESPHSLSLFNFPSNLKTETLLRKCSCLYLPEEGDPVFSVVTQNQYEPRNATESTKSWCPQTRELSFVLVGGFKADIMKVRSISRNF